MINVKDIMQQIDMLMGNRKYVEGLYKNNMIIEQTYEESIEYIDMQLEVLNNMLKNK